ncbi:MAG: hypothetical protein KG003_14015 [Bacteroidetes bacterium]|nr:hypothetical protein [Bacteroidota bacterium]
MKINLLNSVIIGVVSTIGMSILMLVLSNLGFPEMNPPKMMAHIMHQSLFVGWIIHLMIGITFSIMFHILYNWKLHTKSWYLNGVIFGILAWILAQIGFGVIGAVAGMPPARNGSMELMIAGSILTHLFFGFCVAIGFNLLVQKKLK